MAKNKNDRFTPAERRAFEKYDKIVKKTNLNDPQSVRKANTSRAAKKIDKMTAERIAKATGKTIAKASTASRVAGVARAIATRAGNPLVGAALIAGPAVINKLNKESKNSNIRPAKSGELRNPAVGYSKGGTPVRQVNKRMANGAVSDAAKMISPGRSSAKNTKSSLDNAIKQYRQMLSKSAKTGKKVDGMTKNQISNRLDQLLEQRKGMK